MKNYDFTTLSRTFIGFDRMAGLIDNASKLSGAGTYPPYNIAQLGENDYRIELAVAGFSEQDLTLETHENVLTIIGVKSANENEAEPAFDYLHRGIAERGFERRFQLADHVIVSGADLANGMLRIELRRELPDAMKPKTIKLGGNHDKTLTSQTPSRKRRAA